MTTQSIPFETLEIPLSKGKLIILFVGSLLFVAAGFWFIKQPETITQTVAMPPAILILAGYTSLGFFGSCAIFIFKKFFDTKAGIIINRNGIYDNSSGVSAGFIPWGDISNISTMEISKQKLIMIEVINPEVYINRQTNFIAKKASAINHKMYGSPINISANSLQYKFDDLYYTLRERWQQNTAAR
ncbi:STM3941 family protein [Mucilaginibacter phyllosphaerae]